MTKDNPKVTVIIPTFNRGQYLKACLDSVINQTLLPYQVLVINDGSTDDTKKSGRMPTTPCKCIKS